MIAPLLFTFLMSFCYTRIVFVIHLIVFYHVQCFINLISLIYVRLLLLLLLLLARSPDANIHQILNP